MFNIYVDMDDVVADFTGVARTIVGPWDPELERIPDDQWNLLKQYPRIYRSLPVRPGGRELINWLIRYRRQQSTIGLYFLTAVPRGNDVPWAFTDKVFWGKEHFPELPVFFGPYSKDKAHHCRPGDILIDDRTSNCVAWQAAGGIAHQYVNWPECQKWLEETLK